MSLVYFPKYNIYINYMQLPSCIYIHYLYKKAIAYSDATYMQNQRIAYL